MQIYGFVDGAYFRESAGTGLWVNPYVVINWAIGLTQHNKILPGTGSGTPLQPRRVSVYDAVADDDPLEGLEDYLREVEQLPECDVRPGIVKLGKRGRRQKGVDVLLAGDADFVPVVDEVRRRGRLVLVVADPKALAPELRVAADRVSNLPTDFTSMLLPQDK